MYAILQCNISEDIKNLTKSFIELKSLMRLTLSNNKFIIIPEFFEDIVLLSYLDFRGNKITKLPKKFGKIRMQKDGEYYTKYS